MPPITYQPPFRSFQGFLELIPEGQLWTRIESLLQETTEDLGRLDPGSNADPEALTFERDGQRGYSCIRLVDTFLDRECLKLDEILLACKEAGIAARRQARGSPPIPLVQLLLISPFSQIAQARYAALKVAEPGRWTSKNPVHLTNERLHELIGALAEVLGTDRPSCPNPGTTNFAEQMKVLSDLVATIRELGPEAGFELRFYDKFTDAPAYFFGKFFIKGVILDRTAAAKNPWLAFVDDPNQKQDLYDSLSRRVDDLWQDARRQPAQYGLRTLSTTQEGAKGINTLTALIAMPMGAEDATLLNARVDAIKAACEDFDEGPFTIEASRIDDVTAVNRSIDDLLVEKIQECDLLIADLSQNRPNVYYEAGLAQAQNKPVIFIADKKSSEGVGFDLRNYRRYTFDTNEQLQEQLLTGLREIFGTLGLLETP